MGILDYFKKKKRLDPYDQIAAMRSEDIASIMLKAFVSPSGSSNIWDEPQVKTEVNTAYDPEAMRRAIDPISNYFNTLGVYRTGFVKADNDALAENAIFSMIEKQVCDTLKVMDFEIVNKKGKAQEDAMEWLERPNPQQTFGDILAITTPDIARYDAGTWVKTFNRSGNLIELKPYLGTEFWKEIDRVPIATNITAYGLSSDKMIGFWSHGYVQRYWQRSRTGVYISFDPNEICYHSMYKSSGSIYGRDYISHLKWYLQYLIDSTRAAGKTFANGVVPSIVWSHPQIMDRNQLFMRMKEVENENKGSYKFGNILHMVRDEDVKTLSHTLHDMEWVEGQRFIAQMIWAMWGFKAGDFIEGDSNRATSYIDKLSSKSKGLVPWLRHYETMINQEVLPQLEGYEKGWKFSFIREFDLDDDLKQAQILATKVQAANMMVTMGVSPQDALKISKVHDDPQTLEIEKPLQLQIQDMAPKQPVKNAAGAVEGAKGPSAREIPFGDKEERQAGVKKGRRPKNG